MTRPRRVGYLGPEGTVSQAALAAFVAARDPSVATTIGAGVPMPTLRDTVLAVQTGELDGAFVPIENSREGPVNPVWDTIALEATDVRLLDEHIQPVTYCLAVAPGTSLPALGAPRAPTAAGAGDAELAAIRTVYSHPQASAQCARWLADHLPAARVVPAASTADAVQAVASGADPAAAAIGLRFAAERYGARVVADGLEDEPGNATRFALIGREPSPIATGGDPAGGAAGAGDAGGTSDARDAGLADIAGDTGGAGGRRTVLVFWGERDDRAGWLVGCLQPFADRRINLTRIVSRPLRRRMGHYMFFLECDGLAGEDPVAGAIAELRQRAEIVRVLGAYPLAGTGV